MLSRGPVSETERLVVFFETTQAFRDRWALLVSLSKSQPLAGWPFVSGGDYLLRPGHPALVLSMTKQRSFIIMRGVSSKTPLAVIATNDELQELLARPVDPEHQGSGRPSRSFDCR